MSKFDAEAVYANTGSTFAGFFAALRHGFEKAYEQSLNEGFNPDGALTAESAERVRKVYQVLEEQYGSVDLKPLGPLAVVSAFGFFQQVQSLIAGFEAFYNGKPEDFQQLGELLASEQQAKILDSIKYSGVAN